jgi:hypothetical protein
LYKEGKIHFAETLLFGGEATYVRSSDEIIIKDIEGNRMWLADILAHEGTHGVQADKGLGVVSNYELCILKKMHLQINMQQEFH